MPKVDQLQGLVEAITVKDEPYGLWVKAAHKSLFWYRPRALGHSPPKTWAEMVTMVQTWSSPDRAPLSIGAADSWVVTDWFENVLVGLDDGHTYSELANGQGAWKSTVVASALNHLADVWSVRKAFPDGPERAMLTQFGDSVFDVFATDRAAMVFEGDFVEAVVDGIKQAGQLPEDPEVFRFPVVVDGRQPPLVVGGDVAALMKKSEGGYALMRWLAQPETFDVWIRTGGFLSPNKSGWADRPYTPRFQNLAKEIRTETVHFDLSNHLGGRLASSQGRGLAQILTEFFAAVSRPNTDRQSLIEKAQNELTEAARPH